MTQLSVGGYVRHRDRMVQESVFEDLQNTLIACRWMAGTTNRPVVDPYDPVAGWQIVTTAPSDVLRLVGKREDGELAQVVLIDYFPEAGGNADREGESRKTEPNTLAVDTGVAQEPEMVELGSNMIEQPYTFTMAFYAASDAVALALMNDLRDRYAGRIVSDDHLNLYNFNAPGFDETTPPVVRMEVDSFRYEQSTEAATPWEAHLYYAQLNLTDVVDAWQADRLAPPLTPPGLDGGDVLTGHGAPTFPADLGVEYVDLDNGDLYEWTED